MGGGAGRGRGGRRGEPGAHRGTRSVRAHLRPSLPSSFPSVSSSIHLPPSPRYLATWHPLHGSMFLPACLHGFQSACHIPTHPCVPRVYSTKRPIHLTCMPAHLLTHISYLPNQQNTHLPASKPTCPPSHPSGLCSDGDGSLDSEELADLMVPAQAHLQAGFIEEELAHLLDQLRASQREQVPPQDFAGAPPSPPPLFVPPFPLLSRLQSRPSSL